MGEARSLIEPAKLVLVIEDDQTQRQILHPRGWGLRGAGGGRR